MALRWGIVAAGKISHDFARALTLLSETDHKTVAIAARDGGRAQAFSQLHKIGKYYDDYEKLAKDPDVEIVFIGSINSQHYPLAMLMLENGKHVLCEKPMCLNEKQVQKLILCAKSKKLFLMEAMWSRFFPAYQYVKERINDGTLGEVVEVNIPLGFEISNLDRLKLKALGGGTVLDLGVYVIQLSQWIYNELPIKIQAQGKLNEEGVDVEMDAQLIYSNNKRSIIKTSALELLNNSAEIKGTKGTIIIDRFYCPTSVVNIDGSSVNFEIPSNDYNDYNFEYSGGHCYEAEAVRLAIKADQIECQTMSHSESILIAHIQDQFRKQLGVHYPEDSD